MRSYSHFYSWKGKNGESKSEESLRGFYLDGLNKFEEKLEKDFNDLSISNGSNTCR